MLPIIIVSILIIAVVILFLKICLDYRNRKKADYFSSAKPLLIECIFFIFFTFYSLTSIIHFISGNFASGWFLFAFFYLGQILILINNYVFFQNYVQLKGELVIIHSAFKHQRQIHISDIKGYDLSFKSISYYDVHYVTLFQFPNNKLNKDIIGKLQEIINFDVTDYYKTYNRYERQNFDALEDEKKSIFLELGENRAKYRKAQIRNGIIKFIAFTAVFIGLAVIASNYINLIVIAALASLYGLIVFVIAVSVFLIDPHRLNNSENKIDLLESGIIWGPLDSKVKGGNQLQFEKTRQKLYKFAFASAYFSILLGYCLTLSRPELLATPTYENTVVINGTVKEYRLFSEKYVDIELNEFPILFTQGIAYPEYESNFTININDSVTIYVKESTLDKYSQAQLENGVKIPFIYLAINDIEYLNMDNVLADYHRNISEVLFFMGLCVLPAMCAITIVPISYVFYKRKARLEYIELPTIN